MIFSYEHTPTTKILLFLMGVDVDFVIYVLGELRMAYQTLSQQEPT